MSESRGMKHTAGGDRFSWWMLLPSAGALLLLWLPFGFAMIGLIEEWDLLDLFTTQGLFFYTHLDGPLAPHALRPLMPFSFALAHVLSPDSFAGWHVLTIAALLAKGWAMTWLGWRATGRRSIGVIAGLLIILYPADTMQLSFRSLHINVAGALALVAAVLAVHAVDTSRRAVARACAIVAGLLFLCGGLMYEAAFTLVAMPFAVLLVRHGMPSYRWLREHRMVVLCWAAAPLSYGIYAVWIGRQISSYQDTVMAQGSGLHYALSMWPELFRTGASRALIGGWIDAARMAAATFQSYGYLAGATLAIAVLCAVAARQAPARGAAWTGNGPGPSRTTTAMIVWMFVAGLVMMLMGYLPFMVSAFHLSVSQRTYLWATPGAVFAWLAVLMLLARAGRPLAVAAAVLFVTLGLAAQLLQFHHYVDLSQRQRTMLRAIVDSFDGKPADRKLVVLDGTSQIGHDWMFIDNAGLQRALSYLFGYTVASPEACRLPSMEWARRDLLGRAGQCVDDGQGWTFSLPLPIDIPGRPAQAPQAPMHLDGRQVLVVTIAADGRAVPQAATSAYRESLAHGDSTIARRYRAILEPPAAGPVAPMFKDQFPQARWRFSFGDWWSLEEVPYGAGWRPSDWIGRGLKHKSLAWKNSPEASLYLQLQPVASPYVLRGLFTDFANVDMQGSMRAAINGREVDLKWTGLGRFEAPVPQGLLTSGRNELVFRSPIEPKLFGLSARIDWVALDPQKEAN